MAPPKVPTKVPPKALQKPIEKPISKTKKNKKKNYQNFNIYLFKVLKQVKKDMGISRKSILIMNNFVYDMLEKLASEAGWLVSHSKRNTLSSSEVQTAVKLLVPGELVKHAHIEAIKAVTSYHNSLRA